MKAKMRQVIRTHLLDLYINLIGFFQKKDQNQMRHFAIGLPRSGTHSISSIFESSITVAHEPRVGETVKYILRYKYGNIGKGLVIKYLKYRDKKINIELEAAHYLHHISDILVEAYPNSKYILTVREPLSWIESEIGKNLRTYKKGHYADKILRKFRYGRYNFDFSDQETPVKGIYPIKSYLAYWKDHVEKVINTIPENRLLILHTDEISGKINLMSDFLNIDLSQKKINSHSDKLNRESLDLESIASVENYIIPLIKEDLLGFINENLPSLLDKMTYLNKK